MRKCPHQQSRPAQNKGQPDTAPAKFPLCHQIGILKIAMIFPNNSRISAEAAQYTMIRHVGGVGRLKKDIQSFPSFIVFSLAYLCEKEKNISDMKPVILTIRIPSSCTILI